MPDKERLLMFTTRTTERGFSYIEFYDDYGVGCSLQKSSSADYNKIWLGCNDACPKVLSKTGWVSVEMPDGYIANTRMHLTQEQVAKLIPILEHFVKTGELPTAVGKD
jgi:hypothetical protein